MNCSWASIPFIWTVKQSLRGPTCERNRLCNLVNELNTNFNLPKWQWAAFSLLRFKDISLKCKVPYVSWSVYLVEYHQRRIDLCAIQMTSFVSHFIILAHSTYAIDFSFSVFFFFGSEKKMEKSVQELWTSRKQLFTDVFCCPNRWGRWKCACHLQPNDCQCYEHTQLSSTTFSVSCCRLCSRCAYVADFYFWTNLLKLYVRFWEYACLCVQWCRGAQLSAKRFITLRTLQIDNNEHMQLNKPNYWNTMEIT